MSEPVDPHLAAADLDAYLDRAVANRVRLSLESHLAGCAECQRRLAARRRFFRILESAPAPALGRDLSPAVLAAISRPERWPARLPALAGVELLIAAGLLLLAWFGLGVSEPPAALTRVSIQAIAAWSALLRAIQSGWADLGRQLLQTIPTLAPEAPRLTVVGIETPLLWVAAGAALALLLAGNRALLGGQARSRNGE